MPIVDKNGVQYFSPVEIAIAANETLELSKEDFPALSQMAKSMLNGEKYGKIKKSFREDPKPGRPYRLPLDVVDEFVKRLIVKYKEKQVTEVPEKSVTPMPTNWPTPEHAVSALNTDYKDFDSLNNQKQFELQVGNDTISVKLSDGQIVSLIKPASKLFKALHEKKPLKETISPIGGDPNNGLNEQSFEMLYKAVFAYFGNKYPEVKGRGLLLTDEQLFGISSIIHSDLEVRSSIDGAAAFPEDAPVSEHPDDPEGLVGSDHVGRVADRIAAARNQKTRSMR